MPPKKTTFKPSAKAIAAKTKAKASKPPPCNHPYLVPLETRFAKVIYPHGYKEAPHYDYAANIMGANISRVKTYYCPSCQAEILAPKRKV